MSNQEASPRESLRPRAARRRQGLAPADRRGIRGQLKSNFADFANVGGREGGACTAATYLSKFAKDLDWAHLDVAGTAWLGGSQKGSTGRPVPLLVEFLVNRAAALSRLRLPSGSISTSSQSTAPEQRWASPAG